MKLKVLSLFDGMSVAQQALTELGYELDYYASEIDPYAIAVTQSNFPNTIQLGDVSKIDSSFYNRTDYGLPEFDLLIGGSPCQDLSIAKKDRKGLDGERSSLFWEYVRILNEVKPKYFVLENVASMPKKDKDIITQTLGVEPIMINASLVSAQNRKRLFWTNIPKVTQPEDKDIWYQDIIHGFDKDYELSEKTKQIIERNFTKSGQELFLLKEDTTRIEKISYPSRIKQHFGLAKIPTLTSSMGSGGNNVAVITQQGKLRKLTPTECLRLQSMPDNYFDKAIYKGKPISNSQRYKMCGNAFNCAVVKHILKNI